MNRSSTKITRLAEIFACVCVGASLALIQVLIGGMRLLFSLPAYSLVGAAACVSVLCLRRVKPEPDQLCLWSTTIFISYIVARALWSPVPYLARPDIYSVLGGLTIYLLIACVLTKTRFRMSIVVLLLLLAVIQVGIGAIQFRDGDNFMLIPFLQRFDYGRRASGFYICPNHFAGMLEVLGVFAISIAFWSRWPAWGKLLVGYFAAICYAGLILTGSRGGYLSAVASLLAFGALTFIVLRRTDRQFSWKIAGAGLVFAGIIAGSCLLLLEKSDYLSGRAGAVVDPGNIRLDFWQAALRQWRLQPLVGTGGGTYLFFGRHFRTDRMDYDPVEVHNDYLQLLAEYGIVGALAFLAFFSVHVRRAAITFQQLGPKRVTISGHVLSDRMALNVGAICSIVAYIVHSAFDFNLHVPANVLLLAFVFGLIANPGVERNATTSAVSTSLTLWRLALPVLGLSALIASVRLLPAEYFAERARTALRDFHPADATWFALRGLVTEKTNPDLYNYLGRARLDQGYRMRDPRARRSFYEAALDAFWKGRALAPEEENFALELGYTYDALQRYREAEWVFDQAVSFDPKSKAVRQSYQAHLDRWRNSGSE